MQPELIAQISVSQLAANVASIRSKCDSGQRICAALKANAYGHGVELVLPILQRESVELAAVSTLAEAIQLRQLGWTRPVLCLGQPFAVARPGERADRLTVAVEHDVSTTITRYQDARDLSDRAKSAGRVLDVHVNVDTGMGRLGLMPDQAGPLCHAVCKLPGLRLKGIYTHFAAADDPDSLLTDRQLERFTSLLAHLASEGLDRPEWVHAANSAAALRGLGRDFDLVRIGLAMYGYHSSPNVSLPDGVFPILRLVSHLILAKNLPQGHAVGYGATFMTQRPTRVGVVPIGYADGYVRNLSDRARMEVNGSLAPVIGKISMDLTVLDVTDVPDANPGVPVTVFDNRPDRPNSVESLARLLDTIPYEITCLLGDRIQRVAVGDFDAGPKACPGSAHTRACRPKGRQGKVSTWQG